MNPTKIDRHTRILGAPSDWDKNLDGGCDPLYIRDDLVNGSSTMMSTWKPDADELAALNAGGEVLLGICGSRHPPAFVMVQMPRSAQAQQMVGDFDARR